MFELTIYHRKMGFTETRRIEADTFAQARKKLFRTFDQNVWLLRTIIQVN